MGLGIYVLFWLLGEVGGKMRVYLGCFGDGGVFRVFGVKFGVWIRINFVVMREECWIGL